MLVILWKWKLPLMTLTLKINHNFHEDLTFWTAKSDLVFNFGCGTPPIILIKSISWVGGLVLIWWFWELLRESHSLQGLICLRFDLETVSDASFNVISKQLISAYVLLIPLLALGSKPPLISKCGKIHMWVQVVQSNLFSVLIFLPCLGMLILSLTLLGLGSKLPLLVLCTEPG